MAAGSELVVRLVSNQPVDASVAKIVIRLQADEPREEDTRRFAEAAGLERQDLLAFLNALDFSEMGAASRLALKDTIAAEIAQLSGDQADQPLLALQTRVRELMLPGAEGERITRETVLSWFAISSVRGLFPAPADLALATPAIARAPTRAVCDALAAGSRLVFLHGPAGCGKTTTMMQIHSLLPKDSISVVFDCYGAGRYSHSNDRRHLPENAFLQIANDLATAQGTPFLLAKASRNPADIRIFLERVGQAAELLRRANPEAILVVLIDAADNSVAAAAKTSPPSPCFLWEIAEADLSNLPANVRFVVSSRSARKDKLRLPSGTPEVPCPEFTPEEARAYVRLKLPEAPQDWIDQFYALSAGVPRVEAYAFARGGNSPDDILDSLRPFGKKLDTVLRELFLQAASKTGDSELYGRCVAAIAALPAPIPLKHLAGVCRSSVEAVTDFVSDVQPTLRIEDGSVAIADEDVEDFLHREASSNLSRIREEACSYFRPLFRTDPYAATEYCDLLEQAGLATEILPIVEEDLVPQGIPDPIVRREVQVRRLRLALRACRSAKSSTGTLKVVLLSAEATKDEAALRDLLEAQAELSVRFASGSISRLILSDRDQYPKQGSILVQDAARTALLGDFVSARERIFAYMHWMDRRKDVSQRDVHEWQIPLEDIVALAEARILIEGPDRFIPQLRHWRPVSWQPRVALKLVPKLIARGHVGLIEKTCRDRLLPRPWNLFVTVPLALAGHEISTERLREDLASLRRINVPDLRRAADHGDELWRLDFLELIVTACEIAFVRGIAAVEIRRVLDLILEHRESPGRDIPHREAAKTTLALRAWLLRLTLDAKDAKSEDYLTFAQNTNPPRNVKGKKRAAKGSEKGQRSSGYDRSLDDAKRTIEAVFLVYKSRVDALTQAAREGIDGKPKIDLAGVSPNAYYFDREYFGSAYRVQGALSIARLMHIKGIDTEYLLERATDVANGENEDLFGTRVMSVWEAFLLRPSAQQSTLNGVAHRARALRSVRTGAKAKTDAFLDFSRLVLNFSPEDARALFETAVEITQEIDQEAVYQIKFVASVAARRDTPASEDFKRAQAATYASFVTDVAIRLDGMDHFPWRRAVTGLLDFSPEVALCALSQWQDEGMAALEETLPPALASLSNLSPNYLLVACSLLGLLRQVSAGDVRPLLATTRGADSQVAEKAFQTIATKVLLDVRREWQPGLPELLLELAPPGMEQDDLAQRLRRLAANFPDKAPASKSETDKEIELPGGIDLTTEAGIRNAIDELEQTQRLKQKYVSTSSILEAIRRHLTSPAQRMAFLAVLADVEDDTFRVEAKAEAILQALEDWRSQPAVERWRTTVLPDFIGRNLWTLSRWLDAGSSKLPKLIQVSGLGGTALIELLGKALEESPEDFSSATLFQFAEIIARALTPQEGLEITDWYVSRIGQGIPSDISERFQLTEIPAGLNLALGRFLFALMSDVDVRMRWRAARCLRTLTGVAGSETLKSVLQTYDRKTDGAFRLKSAPFYWLAARLWTTMTVARIGIEAPEVVAQLAEKLYAIATDEGLPHYLIREHAKNALNAALAANPSILTAEQKLTLSKVNLPAVPPRPQVEGDHHGLGRGERGERRFSFNSLDTIPYWYAPLQALFANLSGEKFFATLEGWLVDRWRADPESNWWVNEPRKARITDRNSMLSHHGHGSLPTLERFGTYLEWHAMFCGLGEWLESEPLLVSTDPTDRLEYWARRWQPTETPTWLADRRTFAPLDHHLILEGTGDDKHWLRRVAARKFIEAACGDSYEADFAVFGEWTLSSKTRGVEVEVRTALVEPRAALALARTISGEPRTFWLPSDREEIGDEEATDFDAPPYRLDAWLARVGRDREFDELDPLRRGVRGLQVRPSAHLLAKYALRAGGIPTSEWRDEKGTVSFGYEAWSDLDDQEDRRGVPRARGSSGYRLKVRKQALLIILTAEQLDLIADISIDRRLESEYGEPTSWDDKKKRKTSRQVLVFRRGGEIEGIKGYLGTWHRAHQAAGSGC
jgi:hypothetical protein